MRKLNFLILIGLLVTGVLVDSATPEVMPVKVVNIGSLNHITGLYASWGEHQTVAVALAVEEINNWDKFRRAGYRFNIFTYDDASIPGNAPLMVRKAILDDKCSFLVGPIVSTCVLSNMAIVKELGRPWIITSVVDKITEMDNPWVFRFVCPNRIGLRLSADFIATKLMKTGNKFGMFSANTEYGQTAKGILNGYLKDKFGIIAVADVSHDTGSLDNTAQILKLKAAGATVVALWSAAPADCALVVKQAKELGYTPVWMVGDVGNNPKFLELAKDAAEGVYSATTVFNGAPDPGLQKFVKNFTTKAGKEPSWVCVGQYDALWLIAEIILKVGPDPDKIKASLENTSNWEGIVGTYTFTPKDRNGIKSQYFVKWENGKLVMVSKMGELK
jgi:branched-chain amino acid transport system substrate-binding protein